MRVRDENKSKAELMERVHEYCVSRWVSIVASHTHTHDTSNHTHNTLTQICTCSAWNWSVRYKETFFRSDVSTDSECVCERERGGEESTSAESHTE